MAEGPIAVCVVLILAVASPALGRSQIKLASVPSEYVPTAGGERPEPVSMAGFSFEVNEKIGGARVVVEYTYPDQPVFGSDGGLGPQPTYVQIPGLTYDPDAKTVSYEAAGTKTVCADVREGRFLLWKKTIVEPTGACIVSARVVAHTEDDGWNVRRISTIDTFFEVR